MCSSCTGTTATGRAVGLAIRLKSKTTATTDNEISDRYWLELGTLENKFVLFVTAHRIACYLCDRLHVECKFVRFICNESRYFFVCRIIKQWKENVVCGSLHQLKLVKYWFMDESSSEIYIWECNFLITPSL